MHNTHSIDHISIQTTDNQVLEVPLVFVEQSNLLSTLNAEKNDARPICLPINKASFNYWRNAIKHSAAYHLKNMTDQQYSHLMTTAEKLKCPIFYAELIEQLIPIDIIQKIESLLEWKKIDEKIIKYSLNKRCIIKSRVNNNQPCISCSTDDTYFVENISTKNNVPQINLWISNPLQKIKTFDGYTNAQFNPMNDTLFLYKHCNGNNFEGCFYFIKENKSKTLPPTHPDSSLSNALFHPTRHIFYIKYSRYMQTAQFLFRYVPQETKIEPIEHLLGQMEGLHFLPYEEKMVYKNHEKKLIVRSINDEIDEKILAENCLQDYVLLYKNRALITRSPSSRKTLVITHDEPSIIRAETYIIKRIQDMSGWDIPLGIAFNRIKRLYAYTASSSQINICQVNGEIIALHKGKYYIHAITFHPNGNHLIAINSQNKPSPYPDILTIWDISNTSSSIKGKIIHTNTTIKDISFINNDFFLSHGHKTIVWNTQGDKIYTLDKNESAYALTPSHLITGTYINNTQKINGYSDTSNRRTELYHTSNLRETLHSYIAMRNRLSLSEKLLLCTYHKEYKECSRDLPNGRALTSLRNKIEETKDQNIRKILGLLGQHLHFTPQ